MISGLYYIPNYLTQEETTEIENYLLQSKDWFGITKNKNSRRVIHFGYSYSYDRSGIKKIKDIPSIFKNIIIPERINQIINTDLIKNNMDQLIINEYKPGQGIAAHIDHEKFFGPIIICLTVFSGTEINFINKFNDLDVKTIRVEPRSLYIMSGDARYKYKHEICHRIEDHGIKRGTRISLTYRSVINT